MKITSNTVFNKVALKAFKAKRDNVFERIEAGEDDARRELTPMMFDFEKSNPAEFLYWRGEMGGLDSWFKAETVAEGFVYQGETRGKYNTFRAEAYAGYIDDGLSPLDAISAAIKWQYDLPEKYST